VYGGPPLELELVKRLLPVDFLPVCLELAAEEDPDEGPFAFVPFLPVDPDRLGPAAEEEEEEEVT
jgi:hypothetical protein